MSFLGWLVPGLGSLIYMWVWVRWEVTHPYGKLPTAKLARGRITLDSDTIGLV